MQLILAIKNRDPYRDDILEMTQQELVEAIKKQIPEPTQRISQSNMIEAVYNNVCPDCGEKAYGYYPYCPKCGKKLILRKR